jgi:DNA-binding XRE family transcriptional regulator
LEERAIQARAREAEAWTLPYGEFWALWFERSFFSDTLVRAPDRVTAVAPGMARRLVVNGKRARRLRERAKLTQERAAVRVGLAASSLRRIETGERSVQLTTLGKLADLYGVKPAQLLRWRK